jgi:glycosyltransferase involved in cell wall biosynthesis
MPRDVKHYIAVSDFSKNIIKSSLPTNIKIYDLANPIDVVKREPVKVRENRSFVMVGRLSQEKGPHLFARAASDLDLPVTFMGNGECRSDIQRICDTAKILGWRTAGEVLNQLQTARALVFPSLWYETQGLSLLEAAALGVPSIVSDTCAARDSVVDTVTGLWFKSGDKDDLCRKIRVLQDDDTVETMGQSAYDHYWSHPSTLQAYLAKLESIYQEVQSTAF